MGTSTQEKFIISKGNGNQQKIALDYYLLRKAVLTLRAINHHLRRELIKLLEEHKQLTVTEIYVKLGLEQSVASQHLALLRKAGVVKTSREGKFSYYSLDKERLEEIADLVEELARD